MRKILMATTALFLLTACDDAAKVASRNLSKAADQFEISRRIVFYNGITGDYILVIEGLCSLGAGSETKSLTVTCKTGPNNYKKHFLGLSDNVTWFAEQVQQVRASEYRYRVIFRPSMIVPEFEVAK